MEFNAKLLKQLLILDFDTEARPLGWYGGDWVHKEVTAIAAKFIGQKKTHVWLLGINDPVEMLEGFAALYNKADIVTGHYIRGFDLPLLNWAMIDNRLAPLADKLTQDTKGDLIKMDGVSKSQENLGAVLGLDHPKIQMNQQTWREANRLTPKGIKLVKQRVIGDIDQHIEFRQKLIDLHMLGPAQMWYSTGKLNTQYTP